MNSKTLIVRFPAAVCILLILFVGRGLGQETKLKWFGHAAFAITPVNPEGTNGKDALASITKVDEVMIAMTPAVHSSSVFNPQAGANDAERVYGGNPAGFVVSIRNGPVIYHSGDTAYFRDMETIGKMYAIDVALLNIGGHFGMETKMAARAAQSLRTKQAIPQHFGTSPGITKDATGFAAELKLLKVAFREMKPGETLTFQGSRIK